MPDSPSLWEIQQELTRVTTTVTRMDHDLYGNGQKGFIEEVRDTLSQGKGLIKAGVILGFIITILVGILTIRDFTRKASLEEFPSSKSIPATKQLSDAP